MVEGQLTATLHLEPGQDEALIRELLPVLELKAGRILANGFPTGVEVCQPLGRGTDGKQLIHLRMQLGVCWM